jgi:hypothetical protein
MKLADLLKRLGLISALLSRRHPVTREELT